LLSVSTSVLAYLWLSQADALWMLFAARAVQGISAGNISVAQAFVADITTAENRAKGMGLLGAAYGLGFTLGPWVGGELAGAGPHHPSVILPSLAAAGMSAIALILAFALMKEPLSAALRAEAAANRKGRIEQIVSAFSRPRLRLVMLLFFATTFAFAGMETTFAQWALDRLDWGPQPVGRMFGMIGVLLIMLQGGLIGQLVKQFGERRLVLAGMMLIGIGLLGMALSWHPILAVMSTSLMAIGQGITAPTTSALGSREAQASEQGGILGVNQSVGSLARLLGPTAAGLAYQYGGASAPYFLGAAVMLGTCWLGLSLIRQPELAVQEATAAP
jgi:DHA1 family tetracycline resistance protein-like MFS transporter